MAEHNGFDDQLAPQRFDAPEESGGRGRPDEGVPLPRSVSGHTGPVAAPLPYLVDDSDTSELQDGNPLRIFHQGSPLCFDLDHFVHKQGLSDDFLTQSIAMSQSIFRITVQEVKCTPLALVRFYGKRNPEKCADVPLIAEKYAGAVPSLLEGLRKKYGTPTLDPREVSTQTAWRLQSTMSGTYLTSLPVDHPQAASAAYLKAHEKTGLTPGVRESFIIEATDEPTYFHIRSAKDGYLAVESTTGCVATTGSLFEASKFQLASPGFQRASLEEMIKSASYRQTYDQNVTAMAKSTITTPEASAAASTVLLAGAPKQDAADDDDDDWEMVEMTDKMTDDVMTVSTFEYQRRYPFQGWLPLMLPTDPPAWADETGRLYLPLSSFQDSKGWMWTTDWSVDLFRYQDEEHTPGSGQYSGEAADLNSIASAASHHIDSAGWEYANARLGTPASMATPGAPSVAGVAGVGKEASVGAGFRFGPKKKMSLLRRRKWIRRRCKVQAFDQSLYQSQRIYGTLGQAQQEGRRKKNEGGADADSGGKNRGLKKAREKLADFRKGFKSGIKSFWGTMSTPFKQVVGGAESQSNAIPSTSTPGTNPNRSRSTSANRSRSNSNSNMSTPSAACSKTTCSSNVASAQHDDGDHTPSSQSNQSSSSNVTSLAQSGQSGDSASGSLSVSGGVVGAKDMREVAVQLFQQQRFEDALEAVNTAVDDDSNDPRVFRLRAAVKLELGESVMALTDANYSIALDATAAVAHVLKGEALHRLRQYERALDSTNKAIALVEQNGESTPAEIASEGGWISHVGPRALKLLERIERRRSAAQQATNRDTNSSVAATALGDSTADAPLDEHSPSTSSTQANTPAESSSLQEQGLQLQQEPQAQEPQTQEPQVQEPQATQARPQRPVQPLNPGSELGASQSSIHPKLPAETSLAEPDHQVQPQPLSQTDPELEGQQPSGSQVDLHPLPQPRRPPPQVQQQGLMDMAASIGMGEPVPLNLSQSLYESFGSDDEDSSANDGFV